MRMEFASLTIAMCAAHKIIKYAIARRVSFSVSLVDWDWGYDN